MLLENKTAIVTGATRGIGHAIAIRFAKEGCNVAFCGRTRGEKMVAVEQELQALGVKAKGYAADVADYASAQALVKEVLADFGNVDILINNAGITDDAAVKRMTEEQFDHVIGTNLKSVFCMTKAVQPAMWKQGHGSIVNIGSVVGIAGNYNQANYAASKAGIIGLTKSVARELAGRNVTVNAVAPGYIGTDMTNVLSDKVKEAMKAQIPAKRIGTPEDVANVVAFLCSDEAAYVTGEVIRVDGGLAM